MGRVVGLHRTPQTKLPPERIDEAVVVADFGIEGDRHARPGSSRQVVLTQREVLDELGLAAGATREQLTVSGLGATLAAGDVLEIGTVRLELVRPRVPCRVMDKVRPGLRAELEGRGGWCARVLAGGTLRCGDVVTVGSLADPPWLADYRLASASSPPSSTSASSRSSAASARRGTSAGPCTSGAPAPAASRAATPPAPTPQPPCSATRTG
jgi:MOSC domain-containing protein YiiM